MWCIPTIDDEYTARMHDILDLYERSHDPKLPVVCLDEKSLELHGEKHRPIRTRSAVLRDHEYIRHGTANIFMITEPKGGRHYVRLTTQRTRKDFAHCLKWLASRYPDAVTIHLVMDNLNTHTEKSLIETYGQTHGRRLWARFTVHYTPKHASWLNQAEIAISIMSRCCFGGLCIPDMVALQDIVIPFWAQRRKERWKIDWRFTTKKANLWLNSFMTEH